MRQFFKNIGIAVGVWFVSQVVTIAIFPASDNSSGWTSLAALLIPIVAAIMAIRFSNQRYRQSKEQEILDANARAAQLAKEKEELLTGIERHRHALTRNYRRAVQTNDYGVVKVDKRHEAVSEFFESINFFPSYMTLEQAFDYVQQVLESPKVSDEDNFDPSYIPSNGHEFEYWVAESLRSFEWEAEATTKSGDQGIDVIARKNGISVGIQCKLYSQAVGNKAVQEAIAGAQYYGLQIPAVLTNASFTRSAIDLAQVAQVLLLSPYDIPKLETLCANIKPRQQ